jgi:hypothetical protein
MLRRWLLALALFLAGLALPATPARCCPSQPPVTITSTWDGSRLLPDGTPPTWGKPIPVTFNSA